MALGISTGGGGGDIKPRIEFNAKSGRFSGVEREQDAGGNWYSEKADLPLPMDLIVDFDATEIGWITYTPAPDFKMVPVGQALSPSPGQNYKQGVRLEVCHPQLGWRQLSTTAGTVLGALDPLHTQFEADKAANPGKVPVVHISGTTGIQGKHGTNYVPRMQISRWVDAPAKPVDWGGEGTNAPNHTHAAAIQTAAQAPAPAPQMTSTPAAQPADAPAGSFF